jgi:hypothetical protein
MPSFVADAHFNPGAGHRFHLARSLTLDDMARASPPLSIRLRHGIQCAGIADLRGASAMKAAKD